MASQRQHDGRRKERNAELLDQLLRSDRDPLLRPARFHSEREADAEDALGEACVQFLRSFDGEERDHALRYLLVVIKRCAWGISRTRRNRRRLAETVSVDDLEAELGAGIADESRGPEQLLEAGEEVARFGRALDALKADQRRALILLALGYSYEEIAETCEWTRTKVNRSIADGRSRLRQLLGGGGESS
jgi:RNA polymerase sigma factor (sigma-70 family)